MRSSCGLSGTNPPKFCFGHKKDGMVNVYSKKCAKEPSFGVAGTKKAEFCS